MLTFDSNLQKRVLEELAWEPSVDAAHIGVTAENHVVTLTGSVPSYFQKTAAERAVARVFGVQAIANDIEVTFPGQEKLSDADIARAALDGLQRSVSVPRQGVEVTVRHGIVTLRGAVEWRFQRQAAENAVHDLAGVVDVINMIEIKPRVSGPLLKRNIERAFQRNASIDARRIDVQTDGGTITLTGTVHSLQERREAERAAWAAPGAHEVKNHLLISA